MRSKAPTREQVDKGWTPEWMRWLQNVYEGLAGWNKSITTSATIDFLTVAAESERTSAVTVTGARAGDAVEVTPAANTIGIVYAAVVTSDNTVTVYAKNFTSAAIDPVAQSFRIIVKQN